jgi:glutamate-5-semialdehyde dehydrogenase
MTVETVDLTTLTRQLGDRAREAALDLAIRPTADRNRILADLADRIENSREALEEANGKDLEAAGAAGISGALLDRLRLTGERITAMAEGVRQVVALPDPVGEELERLQPPSGIDIRKVRVPLGVVAIIYESRPNVTIDCAALCLKSGNACLLRGGKEAFHSNTALAGLVTASLEATGLPAAAVQLVPTTDRAALQPLLRMDDRIHCIIPRGGKGLIRTVVENATVPVLKHDEGVCNLYIDRDAEPTMATALALNAKTQRPGVCNAIENLVVHEDFAADHLPALGRALTEAGVELRADEAAHALLATHRIPVEVADHADWSTEYLDLILAVRTVSSTEEAVSFINEYGSQHSDAIVTADETTARHFLAGVDSATVYWNASTRFTDGFAFGLGAEIGISTDRLHARGPMGLRELCTYKYEILGHGEVRA